MLMPHLETIWAAKVACPSSAQRPYIYQRARWSTPDEDFIDVDFLPVNVEQLMTCVESVKKPPLWVMFHGLEGSSQSHYARAFASFASDKGLHFCIPHFRGCSGQINLAPRAYHSGDFEEIDWILRRLKEQYNGDVYVIGVSLGGNALMRWAGEVGSAAASMVKGIVSICSPLDLTASGHHLWRGLNRHIYTPMFLRSMKPNALKKLEQYPNLFDKNAMLASRNLYEFDNVVTAPIHGFKNTEDYWTRASAKPHMQNIQVSALAINAINDPFIPPASLPTTREVSPYVKLWQPPRGGHVGFVADMWRGFPGHLQTLPQVVDNFFATGEISRG
jgi:uncharacterized protein